MSFSVFQSVHDTSYYTFQSPNCDRVNPVIHFGSNLQALNLHLDMIRVESHPTFKELSPVAKAELIRRMEGLEKQKWKNSTTILSKDHYPLR